MEIDVRDLCLALGVEYDPAKSSSFYLMLVKQYRLHYVAAQHSVQSTLLTDNKRQEWLDSLPDGVPCDHVGCLSHISHPCESCGRIGGRRLTKRALDGAKAPRKSKRSTGSPRK